MVRAAATRTAAARPAIILGFGAPCNIPVEENITAISQLKAVRSGIIGGILCRSDRRQLFFQHGGVDEPTDHAGNQRGEEKAE